MPRLIIIDGAPYNEQTAAFSAGAGGAGFTLVPREWAIDNNVIVTQIGFYNTSPISSVVKVLKRVSAGTYDVVVSQAFSHGGSGWELATLPSAFQIPASGDYYVGVYSASNFSHATNATTARTYKAGDITGTGQSGFTEDTASPNPPTRAVGLLL